MSSKDDTGEIVKEFLDLWQKQFSYIAREPETVATMLQTFQSMQDSLFNKPESNNAKSDTSPDIFRDANDELYKLKQRIASLEARVVELESTAREASETPAKSNKGKRSGGTSRGVKKPIK